MRPSHLHSVVCKGGDCDVKVVNNERPRLSGGGSTKGGPRTPPTGPLSPLSHHAGGGGRHH